MSNSKFQTVYGVRVYPIDYLKNEEYTESDLNCLCDTNSLIYSLIIGMFRKINSKKKNSDIIKTIKKENWVNYYSWTKTEFYEYEDDVVKIFRNLYQCGEIEARSKAQWFMIKYALTVKP